jgi:general secretion pathway protein K
MRPSLYASAAPYLTVFSGAAVPDAYSAEGIVLQAMGVERPRAADPDAVPLAGSGTYSIDSRARRADGRSARVSVILRLGGNGLPGSAYTPLRWQDGPGP